MSYFNLHDNPRTAIKSKASGGKTSIDLTNFQPSPGKRIEDDWNVKPGDVISWGDYRAVNTYFVDSKNRLLENEDTSGSGYLTIPLSISSLFPSVLAHYASFMETQSYLVSAIEIPSTDAIFVEKFGRPLPESIRNRNDISYIYDPIETSLVVIVGKNPGFYFPLVNVNTQDIVDYIEVANEKKASFYLTYDIEGADVCSKWPSIIANSLLPKGWNGEHGNACSGHGSMRGTITLNGPAKTKSEAYEASKKYYDGFNVSFYG